jgi:threonine dehydrogenase-like Zn-dependent dehydrogenase
LSTRELWFTGPRAVEVRMGPDPGAPDPDQLIVRCIYSGVSHGTERLLYLGEAPSSGFDDSLGNASPNSSATYPRRYGYAWVGRVERGEKKGALVFGLLAHGDVHRVAWDALRVLPEDLPPRRAVLAANAETAVNCVWDARISLGDRVCVLGGGEVGALVATFARRAGADVTVIEPAGARREILSELGLVSHEAAHTESLADTFDVVVEATGRPAALDLAMTLAAREARVAVASFYGARRAPVDLGVAFHRKRLVLVSTQVSAIPADKASRWSFGRRFELVTSLLRDDKLDALLGEPVPFDQAPRAYASLATEPGPVRKIVFAY